MRKPILKSRFVGRLIPILLCVAMMTPLSALASAQQPSNASTVTITIPFPEPHLQQTLVNGQIFTTVSLPHCLAKGANVGQPSLPVYIASLLLPPYTTVDTITVTGVPCLPETANQPIIPYQAEQPVGSAPSPLAFDAASYNINGLYPAEIYDGSYHVGFCRGYTIASLTVMPIQYNPSLGLIVSYSSITISITLKQTGTLNKYYRGSVDNQRWVEALVQNPDLVNSYPTLGSFQPLEYPGGLCDPSDHHEYVIITTTQYGLDDWNISQTLPYNWDSLMTEHSLLSPAKVTKQDILACPDYYNTTPLFNDTQARIREFCRDAYQDWGAKYILICGDSNTMPARQMYNQAEGGSVDADLYWSNLDLSFNADQDSYWGEEGDPGFDLYSELSIGRITADVPQDVSNWMSKSLCYAHEGNPDILDNAAFYTGVSGWNGTWGQTFMEFAAINGTSNWYGSGGVYPSWLGFQYGFRTWNAVHPDEPYNLTEMWSSESPLHPGWQGGTMDAARQGLKDAINNDRVSLLAGIAHGDEHMSLDVYDTDWETQYHNTKPFFIFDDGCHVGDFDATDDGVLETMLFASDTKLAFACLYSSGYTWGSPDGTNSSSALQQKCFWDYLFDLQNHSGSTQNWQLGKALAFSKDEMAPTIDWGWDPGSFRETIQSMLLFGDPAQLIQPPNGTGAPQTPPAPQGPSEGVVGVIYNYTFESVNNSCTYQIDWGDGLSDWLGPFEPGTFTASHMWTSAGTYSIRVWAKDTYGGHSHWSDSHNITIVAPVLVLKDIKGGLGMKIVLSDTVADTQKIEWQGKITGGLLKLIDKETHGSIDVMHVGQNITVRPFLLNTIIGLGPVSITFTATPQYASTLTDTATALLVGPFFLALKQ